MSYPAHIFSCTLAKLTSRQIYKYLHEWLYMLYLLFRFLPIVLFISFVLWLKFRKKKLVKNDPALRYWFWALVIVLVITIGSLVTWALQQKQSIEAQQYEHAHQNTH